MGENKECKHEELFYSPWYEHVEATSITPGGHAALREKVICNKCGINFTDRAMSVAMYNLLHKIHLACSTKQLPPLEGR